MLINRIIIKNAKKSLYERHIITSHNRIRVHSSQKKIYKKATSNDLQRDDNDDGILLLLLLCLNYEEIKIRRMVEAIHCSFIMFNIYKKLSLRFFLTNNKIIFFISFLCLPVLHCLD